MNSDQNIATRRFLQVIIDMLSNPNHATEVAEREGKLQRNESVYGVPSPYRCDPLAVEAAVRAAREAQKMLFDAAVEGELSPLAPRFARVVASGPKGSGGDKIPEKP